MAEAVFRPVRRGNAFEETVERLLQAITLGVVTDGRLPPERELAARLQVSRVTVREAIRALQQAGWVSSRPGRGGGTFLTAPPATAWPLGAGSRPARPPVADTLAFRAVLEPGAAELAASSPPGAATAARIRVLLEDCERAGPGSYRRADSRLHLAIAEAAGSPSLLAAVADVRSRINELLDAIPLLGANLAHANRQHRAVVAAVLAGDPSRARATMADHLEGTAALLRGFLGEAGP